MLDVWKHGKVGPSMKKMRQKKDLVQKDLIFSRLHLRDKLARILIFFVIFQDVSSVDIFEL